MRPSVLIVDDESAIVTSLEFLMGNAGFETAVARDGEQALAKVAETVPDLVILDVMMPKLNGFEVCQRIRANPAWKSVRIILLTAMGRDADRKRGLSLGADDYLTKPFSTRDLLKRAQEIIAQNRIEC